MVFKRLLKIKLNSKQGVCIVTAIIENFQGMNRIADIPWWRDNVRLKDLSGRLLGAHIAKAALSIVVLVRVHTDKYMHTGSWFVLRLTPNGALRGGDAPSSLSETGERLLSSRVAKQL